LMNSTNPGDKLAPSGVKLSGHILLFFSVRSSGYLNGVAEMIGPVDPQKRCTIWLDSRFRGEIPVRWLYVKSLAIEYQYFEDDYSRKYVAFPGTANIAVRMTPRALQHCKSVLLCLFLSERTGQSDQAISIESYDNRPVTVLRDTSEITPAAKGEELLRIVHEYGLPRSVCVQPSY
uniref:YTH domain-containing protein n=1 Tax=Echinostoma caproni TaxID=27848 RepID=A0A183ALM8_9TREM